MKRFGIGLFILVGILQVEAQATLPVISPYNMKYAPTVCKWEDGNGNCVKYEDNNTKPIAGKPIFKKAKFSKAFGKFGKIIRDQICAKFTTKDVVNFSIVEEGKLSPFNDDNRVIKSRLDGGNFSCHFGVLFDDVE